MVITSSPWVWVFTYVIHVYNIQIILVNIRYECFPFVMSGMSVESNIQNTWKEWTLKKKPRVPCTCICPIFDMLQSKRQCLLRSADKVGRPFCCCVVFSFFFLLFLSHHLRSAISLTFFIGSLSYLVSWWIITCRTAVYILGYEGQRSRSQGDTRWKCLFSNFSVIYHPIVFKFSWLIVLDKETTWCKFQGRRLKIKVTRKHPWKISCTLISLLFLNECLWNLDGI